MNAKKLLLTISALAAFIYFAYLGSSPRSHPIPNAAVHAPVAERTSHTSDTETQKEDVREMALELPDSLLPFCRGLSSQKKIALSFDACPTGSKNEFNTAIANTLLDTKTPATIFLSGRWVERDTAATRLLASDSLIEFGNHSYTHPHLRNVSPLKMRQELERAQRIITDLTGQTPFLFRAPYGEYNDTVIHVAKELGLVTVQFSVESGDPDTTFSADRLIKWVMQEARNGSIVIMHINNRGWHTAQALPTIIADLRKKGYTLVKVSDLMKEVGEECSERILANQELKRGNKTQNNK